MARNIDSEVLIALVESRPVLWDKTLDIYKDRNLTKDAWSEVCMELHCEFEKLEEAEKNAFGKEVIGRWSNIRDAFSRSLRRLKESKSSGSSAKYIKQYVYNKELKFLKKLYAEQETSNSVSEDGGCFEVEEDDVANQLLRKPLETETECILSDYSIKPTVTRKRQKVDEMELKCLKALEPKEPEKPDPNMLFFQSLLPHLKNFNAEEILQFQMAVLQVISNLNEKKKGMEVVETRQEQSVLQEASVVTHDQERINIKVEKCMEVVDTDQEQSVLQEASIAIHDQEIMKIKEEICVEEVDANQEQSVLQEASVVVNDKNLMKITEENSAIMGINDIPQERSLMQESPPGHNNDTVMKIQKENYSNESNDQPKSVVSSDKKEDKEDPDLYLYTTLNDFTSEIFKIEVNNLPNYVGYNQLQKLLKFTLKLDPRKVKAIDRNHHFAYITFKNEKDRDQALNLLNGYEWKGKTLTAKKASPSADPMAKKRKAGNSEDCPDSKHIKLEEDSIELSLKDAVIPYWNLSYEEQLKKKEDTAHKFLMKLSKEIEKNNPSFRPLLSKFRKANHHQCCPLAPIKPSPITKGYRNKCEFTVGRHLLTKEKTVGFRLSSYKKGSMSVAGPDVCFNMSEDMLKAVKSFEAYVRESDKDVYNPENHAGYWRQLTVRTSNNADILLIVVMHPQSLSEAEIEEEKTKLKKYFTDGPGSSCKITSIYFHLLSKRAAHEESTALTHLMGKKFLEITLLEMTFQVSPEAFFQINVPATEILYSAVADLVNASSSATVLDICCGTGTISLCLAKAGAKVIGIEMCPEAVENARLNAKNNGLPDVEFICGKAEDVIIPAIQKCDTSEIIAVVDPPRAGLHPKVLKVIRSTAKIQKLIYVSCHPDAALQNFINLCRTPSNAYKGCAFYPVQAMVVDLFPQTTHKELVMVFERSDRLQT